MSPFAELLEDPALPDKLAELQLALDAEQRRREQFYDEIADDAKAEFINGEIIMHAPSKARHTEVRQRAQQLLSAYCAHHRLGKLHTEKSLCVFPRNDYEPDIVFFGPEKSARIEPDTLKFPIPDFICEVLSESTAHRDHGVKFQDYAVHGVAEYWIIDPEREILEQYLPREGRYELALKSGSGEVASSVVPGFGIPIRALFDDAENLRVLRTLLA